MLSTFPLLQINFYIHSIPFSIITSIYIQKYYFFVIFIWIVHIIVLLI